MKLISSLSKLAAPLLFLASCQKELDFVPTPEVMNRPKDTTIVVIPPKPVDTVINKVPKDTVTLMIRDGISDERNGTSYNNFYLEPLQVEVATVPQNEWLRLKYDRAGNYEITATAPSGTLPNMESFQYGYYDTRYHNYAHNNAAGYTNQTLPVELILTRKDSGVVAYGIQKNPTTGANDTTRRATAVRLLMAESAIFFTAPVNGANPMNNGTNNRVSYPAFVKPNTSLGQNGTVYRFTN